MQEYLFEGKKKEIETLDLQGGLAYKELILQMERSELRSPAPT